MNISSEQAQRPQPGSAQVGPGNGTGERHRQRIQRHEDGRPTVLCLHSSTASGRQWRALQVELGDRYRVLAPDLIGYGDAPAWPSARPLTLEHEARRLEPLLPQAEHGVHLVGHSYGGAVALRLALLHPARVRSVTVYEPVLFGLLAQLRDGALDEVYPVASGVTRRVAAGDPAGAAQLFVDYWSGPGSWARLLPWQQAALARRIAKTGHDFSACFGDPMTLAELATLAMPRFCLHGARSPEASRRIARQLIAGAGFSGDCLAHAGHLGPQTDSGGVNARIAAFLDRCTGAPSAHARARIAC